MKAKNYILLSGVCLVAASGVSPFPVLADGPGILEEVVVSARKREENLQEVPDSITAFKSQQIEEQRLNHIVDAIALTPNVHMVNDQDAGTNIITVRGIGTNRNLPASIAFVVDGVILPDSDAFSADMTDVERIEILRGPQGGLYGRNAIGGVISLTTPRPTDEFESTLKLGYGNGNSFEMFGAASGALVPGALVGRATAKYSNSDGFIKNLYTGKNLDEDEQSKITGRLIWQATENLSFDFRGSHFEQDTGALWFSPVNILGTTGGRISKELARALPNQNDETYSERTINDFALVVDLETTAGTFSSISAWDEVDVEFTEDLDVTPLTVTNDAHQVRSTRGVSEELRFTSNADQRFRYIVGVYLQETDRDVSTSAELDFCFLGVPLPFCTTPPLVESGILIPLQLNTTEGDFSQSAIFAQSSFDINDRLELTVALRYDEDQRKQLDVLTGRRDQETFDEFQPKVSLAFQATDAAMLYATYAEGYKSGAFNPPPGPGALFPLVVEQEGTDSYELGMKSTWFGGRAQANVALFYTDYTNVQVFDLDLTTGGQVAYNADEAELNGYEIELAAIPFENFELTASYGYTDATFTNFNGTGLYDGNRLPNTPKNKLNIGGRYEIPATDELNWVLRANYEQTGTIYFQHDNLVYQPSYQTFGLQFGLAGERYSVTVWGKNVFGEDYATSAYSRLISPLIFGVLQLDPVQINPGPQFGIEGRWNF
jgi:iron complex outermembrane receptor protein